MIWNVMSWAMLLSGAAFVIIGGVGLIRLPDFFTRLHAVSIPDTLGAALISAGLIMQAGLSMATLKLLIILAFLLFTGPTATHALAKTALHGRLAPRTRNPEKAP